MWARGSQAVATPLQSNHACTEQVCYRMAMQQHRFKSHAMTVLPPCSLHVSAAPSLFPSHFRRRSHMGYSRRTFAGMSSAVDGVAPILFGTLRCVRVCSRHHSCNHSPVCAWVGPDWATFGTTLWVAVLLVRSGTAQPQRETHVIAHEVLAHILRERPMLILLSISPWVACTVLFDRDGMPCALALASSEVVACCGPSTCERGRRLSR